MTGLSALFPNGPRSDAPGRAQLDDHHTVRRLREMIGEPRDTRGPVRPLADTDALMRRVEAAAKNAAPIAVGTADASRPATRTRRRWDPLATSVGALAVVAAVAAAAVGGVQMATASPAASSLVSLEADEATLQNAHQALTATRNRIVSDIETQTAAAALLRSALVSTSTAPDPASDGDVISVTDPTALATALAAVDAYAAGLAAITVPKVPAEYRRGDIDEESLEDVGSAIDGAQEKLVALDGVTTEMRSIRTQLDALRPPADAAVAAYAATFPGSAEAAKSGFPDADDALQALLAEAAARVGASGLWGAAGVTALEGYRDAFVSVAADQAQVDAEQEQSTRQTTRRTDTQQTAPPSDTTTPTDPPVTETPPDTETPPEGEGTP